MAEIDDVRRTSNGCPVAKRVPRSETNFFKQSRNVAAIDFGTTHCSVAYITKSDGFESFEGPQLLQLSGTHTRVPTAALFKPDGTLESFGQDARTEYLNLDDDKRPEYAYFEQMKMNLQLDENVNRDMKIEAANGQEYFLVEVIAQILKKLKRELLESLERALAGSCYPAPKVTDFDWVITVPAIWKARGKQMMREAGYKAGLCSEDECGRLTTDHTEIPKPNSPEILILALEPESAAVYCQSQFHRQIATYSSPEVLSTGGYMIADIGGGTLDISVYNVLEVGQNHHIDVVQPPEGKSYGGTNVNKCFRDFLQDIVGDPGFLKYVATNDNATNVKHKAQLDELVHDTFEKQKTAFGKRDVPDLSLKVTVVLPDTFARVYGDSVEQRASGDPDVVVKGKQTLLLSHKKLASFFEQVLKDIAKCIQDVLSLLEDQITTVYIVGGFGGSAYVQHYLKTNLNPKYSCRVPMEPQFSVVRGAALYGRSPQTIHARVADATYGVGVSRNFDPTIHPVKYRFFDDDQVPKCNHLFKTFVEKGDPVCTSHVYTGTVYPLYHNETEAKFSVYCTSEKDVWFVTGRPGPNSRSGTKIKIYKVGEFTVQMPILDGDKTRKVKITFDFGQTEIQISGHDKTSGRTVAIVVDFLSSHAKNGPNVAVAEH